MRKLIIPNAYELYQSEATNLSVTDINARFFYNLRFLWLLEPGDAILLANLPSKGFLSYFARLKQIKLNSLHIIILKSNFHSLDSAELLNPHCIARLQKIITVPSDWTIQACYFNQNIVALAEKLNIPIVPKLKIFIKSGYIHRANSKVEFRSIALSNNIPIAEGKVCSTPEELAKSIKYLLGKTDQIIVKEEYNASGKGNIGVSFTDIPFSGVIKTILLKKNQCLNDVAHQLWCAHTSTYNRQLVTEVYYQNKGSFTAQFCTATYPNEPYLVNYSEIIMNSRWSGVNIPPRTLSLMHINQLIRYSREFSIIMQKKGYRGYLCCDAIVTLDDKLLFTEINVRPGAETNAYIMARNFFGPYHNDNMFIFTKNGLKINSFYQVYYKLKKESLLLHKGMTAGLVILTIDDIYSKQMEYLIAAPTLEKLALLTEKINAIL